MTYTPRARRLATLLLIAAVSTRIMVLATTQDRPVNHFRSTPATAVPKDDDCFYSPSDPYANVSVDQHGTTASGVGVWGAYVYPNRIGTVVASSPSAALAAAVRLERSVCWARQITYTPWCVKHVTVTTSHPVPSYPSGPHVFFGYDGTRGPDGSLTIVDTVTAVSLSSALAHVRADCTESQPDS